MAPFVVASRFDHSARRRHLVTWALPGEPILILSSPFGLLLRRSITADQSLTFLMGLNLTLVVDKEKTERLS